MINLDTVKSFFGVYSPKPSFTGAVFYAATEVDTVPPPKSLKPGQRAQPSYLKTAGASSSALPETDRRTANIDINTFRNSASTKSTIRSYAQTDPDMSAATAAASRVGITSSYSLVAYDVDGRINSDATRTAQQLARKIDFLSDYSQGFAKFKDIRSVSESLSKELLIEGSCSMELVLDKTRYPAGFRPISTSQIKWMSNNAGELYPIQEVSGDKINLDTPLFFYVALDQDLLEPYSASQMEAALHATVSQNSFFSDLRRVFRQSVHPRTLVTIVEESWLKTVPPDILNDSDKMQEYRASTVLALQNSLSGLKPEDALVVSDVLRVSTLNTENSSKSEEYKTLEGIINQKSASGTKTMGVVLGHSAASQNVASTESMLYLKTIEGSIQEKLNAIFSRAFTLAVRLYGQDCIVKFKYKPIALRPELEMEAFNAMRQSRIMEQLSIGMMSDVEASIELTGSLPPEGAKELSGTFFKTGSSAGGNPYTNSNPGEGSALNEDLKPDTPTEPKTG